MSTAAAQQAWMEALSARFPPALKGLVSMALDLRWCWSHGGDEVWQALDDEGWRRTQNPFALLRGLTEARLRVLEGDQDFLRRLEALMLARRRYRERETWWQRSAAAREIAGVAYFSMEYGLCEALPLYAGGLGVLAGDLLKTASDLGVPVTGIGLFYRQGYFRQRLDAQGWQQALYVHNDPADLPIAPVLAADGALLSIPLPLPGRELRLRAWRVQLGRTALYLLDSNDPWNLASDRGITDRLYDGGQEERLMQEIVLGIGGWRLVEALGLPADVCHLNEGHAAFAALERAHIYAQRSGLAFHEALWATRAGNIFTTHTAVPAGFDRFPRAVLAPYLRAFAEAAGVDETALWELGTEPVADRAAPAESLNMAWLAARACATTSAVSLRHRSVSQGIFAPLYPRWPLAQIPVCSVTNGVHTPYWDGPAADALWTAACGQDRWLDVTEQHQEAITACADEAIWAMRGSARVALVTQARERLAQHRAQHGGGVDGQPPALDANALTLGFARRFADYKRPDLLLRQSLRLVRLLSDPRRPVQLVIAGKAHPDDDPGKRHLQAWFHFARRPEVAGRVVILEDYDLALAQPLVQGVDVWINNPRVPWEACGTSGMKVLVNGGLNLSSLDGWWEEAWAPELGWALGARPAGAADRDEADAAELMDLLEREVVPLFFERDAQGIPRAWVARVRASMARLAPRYSANRMLRDYVEQLYLPAARRLHRRVDGAGARALELAAWERRLRACWGGVHLGPAGVHGEGAGRRCRLPVYLGDLEPGQVRVQLYAEPGVATEDACCLDLSRAEAIPGSQQGYWYECALPETGAERAFTPRVVPWHEDACVPQELALIRWGEPLNRAPAPAPA